MRPLAVAIALWTVAARPAAAQVPYRVSAWDAASVLAAGGLSIIPEAAGLPRGAPPCAPGDPASLPRIDPAGGSEEGRVGEGVRSRGGPVHLKKKRERNVVEAGEHTKL